MPNIIGVGQLTLTDLNDAIMSGTPPTNPTIGSLWIDESTNPKKLKKWNGSDWDIIGEILDDGTWETIEDIQETLGNMANDNLININERQIIKDKLSEIIGYTIGDNQTLPSAMTLDTSGVGEFSSVRKSAINAGLLTSNNQYTDVEAKYNALIAYLSGLSGAVPPPDLPTIVTDGLLGYWNSKTGVNGNTWENIAPATKGTNNSTIQGASIVSDGMHFDGVDDNVLLGYPTQLRTSTSFTFEFRVKLNHSITSYPNVISTDNTWVIDMSASNGSTAIFMGGSESVSFSYPFVSNTEYYLAYVFNKTNNSMSLYVNGTLVQTKTLSNQNLVLSSSVLKVGSYYGSNNPAGIIDNIRLYNKVLTVQEIQQNHNVGRNVGLQSQQMMFSMTGVDEITVWNTSQQYKDINISVDKTDFRNSWLNYYNSVKTLSEETVKKLKENTDNIIVGGRNFGSNGDFSIPLAEARWKNGYTGQTVNVVDISTEAPPFQFALYVKNTTNANGGIFYGDMFVGSVAQALVGKDLTVQFWLKYQNIVQGTNSFNKGQFGVLVIEGETSTGTKVYSYPSVLQDIVGSNATWTKYSQTFRIVLPPSAIKLTKISLKHGIEGARGEFWTTGIKIESGNKATDWSEDPLDMQGRIYSVEQKILPDRIIDTVRSHERYIQDLSDMQSQIDDKADSNIVETLTSEYNSALIREANAITQEVENKIINAKGEIQEAYKAEVKTAVDSFNITFTEMDDKVSGLDGEMADVKSYFNFTKTGELEIGKSNSPLNIVISNEQIDFVDNKTVVAWINGRMMYIESLHVLQSLIVGNHKIEKYNSEITLVKYSG